MRVFLFESILLLNKKKSVYIFPMTHITHHLFVSPRNQSDFVEYFGSYHQKIMARQSQTNWIIGQCERQTGNNLIKIIDSVTWDSQKPLPLWHATTLVFFSYADKKLFAQHLREKSGEDLPHPTVLMDHLNFLGLAPANFVTARTNFHPVGSQTATSHNMALWMTGMYNILENSI